MNNYSLALVPLNQVRLGDSFYLDFRTMLPLTLLTIGSRFCTCCLAFDTSSLLYLRNDQKVLIRYDSIPQTLF